MLFKIAGAKYKYNTKDDEIKLMIGKILCFAQKLVIANRLSDVEFKVFSQWGEDGIIQYLTSKIPIKTKFFIEFGVENYDESNTRFLLMNNNWGGLIIDASPENVSYIKSREYFWKYDLTAIDNFITKENINPLIESNLKKLEVANDIGILSIDIDGMDYWILKEINCIDPSIIICEYNSIFGNKQPVSVPYDPFFFRTKAHFSNLYFGASLKAFEITLEKKGYTYVGNNSQNVNAFFVKKELAEKFIHQLIVKSDDDFEFSKFRESRNKKGSLNYLRGFDRVKEIQDLEVINIQTNQLIKIRDLHKDDG